MANVDAHVSVPAATVVEPGRKMAGRYKTASIGGIALNVAEC